MAAQQLAGVLRRLRRETAVGGAGAPADRELLARFAADRDGAAFAALVAHHGPMVLGVCRRVLTDGHAAEDAFQATFLVLARRAGSIRATELLGNWLYGTAYRVASRARVEAAKRCSRERMVPARPSPDPLAEITARELVEVLDRELHRLPDECRAALVACYLEDKTRDEAAAELGWSPATLGRRLERGRELLRARLARRGLSLPLALLPVLLAPAASAGVPTSLAESTARAAIGFAVSSTLAIPASAAAALAEGVLRVMSITKLKIGTALLVTAALVAAGVGVLPLTGALASPAGEEVPKAVTAPVNPASERVDPLKANAAELQGTWMLTETHSRGNEVIAADVWLEPSTLVIAGNRVTLLTHPGSQEGTVEADPRANPKQYTFNFKKPQVGIYAVDGDTLKLCFNPANGIRPTDFATPPDSDRVVAVFQRVTVSKEGGMGSDPKPGAGGPPMMGADVPANSDLQKLQGTWVLDVNAVDPGPNFVDPPHDKLEIKGWTSTLHHVSGGRQRSSGSSFEMDEAASGGRITFNWPSNGKAHGIYDLEGDTFRFCYTPGSKDPPAQFGAGPGSKNVLLVYKRQQPAKAEPAAGTLPPFIESRPWGVTAIDADKQTVTLSLLQGHGGAEIVGYNQHGDKRVDLTLQVPRGSGADADKAGWAQLPFPVERVSLDRFPLAKDARVFLDGREDPRGAKGVKAGMRVTVRLTADGAAIARLDATTPGYVVLKAVDAGKNTITVDLEGKEQTLALAAEAKVSIHDKPDARLADLKSGARVALRLGVEKGTIVVTLIKVGVVQ